MALWESILNAGKINPVEQLGSLPLWQRILNGVPETGTPKVPTPPAFGTDPQLKGIGNVGKDVAGLASAVIRAPGRSASSLILFGLGKKELVPTTLWEKILYGNRPVYDVEGEGQSFGQSLGVDEKTAKQVGLPIGFGLIASDIVTGGFGKTIAKKGVVKGVQALKGSADDISPLIQEARKYKTAEESVYRQLQDMIEQGYSKSQIFRKDVMNNVWSLGRESHGAVGFQRGEELFNLAKKNLQSDLIEAKNLGYKNITDFNRASRIVNELQATIPQVERSNALQKLSGVINEPRKIQEVKSQLTDIWKKAQGLLK